MGLEPGGRGPPVPGPWSARRRAGPECAPGGGQARGVQPCSPARHALSRARRPVVQARARESATADGRGRRCRNNASCLRDTRLSGAWQYRRSGRGATAAQVRRRGVRLRSCRAARRHAGRTGATVRPVPDGAPGGAPAIPCVRPRSGGCGARAAQVRGDLPVGPCGVENPLRRCYLWRVGAPVRGGRATARRTMSCHTCNRRLLPIRAIRPRQARE